MARKTTTWIMIADAGRARIFAANGAGQELHPVEGAVFENADAHGHARDLRSDRPGRTVESVGGAHHAEEPRVDPHRQAKAVFAKKLADYVDQAAHAKSFDSLVLVAPPQMLGDLRGALTKTVADRVVGEIAKDLTKIPTAELASHLEPVQWRA